MSEVRGPVVVVADDSATVRNALRGHLAEHGYTIVEADDGPGALDTIRTVLPDVVLLDVELPTVLESLHQDAVLAEIPVVLLIARTDGDSVQAGAYDFLRTPVDAAELVARVSAALRVKRLQDELRARYDELNRLTRLDALTGLLNRGHAEERLHDLCSASVRHRFPISVLLIDLDRFKQVNDTYGHPVGDAVLRAAADCIKSTQRTEDLPARWGGEELLLVLPYTDERGALAVAERIRAEVEATRTPMTDGGRETVKVTASIGLCTGIGLTPEGLVSRADQALYRAKAEGRNRVVVAHHA